MSSKEAELLAAAAAAHAKVLAVKRATPEPQDLTDDEELIAQRERS